MAGGLGGIEPCLWRAATDNDRGGFKGMSFAARWKAAGLDRLQVLPGTVALSAKAADEASPAEGAAAVEVHAAWRMAPGAVESMDGASVTEGVGVGEVGGAHWLALKEASKAEGDRVEAVEGSAEGCESPPITSAAAASPDC